MTKTREVYLPRRANGPCSICGGKFYAKGLCKSHYDKAWHSGRDQSYYLDNKEKIDRWGREYRILRKSQAIEAYGGRCSCCGESEIDFLTIDHIKNDGKEHRAQIGGGGNALYRWLRQNGYPQEGFQCLCFNCNIAKAFRGSCPHQKGER